MKAKSLTLIVAIVSVTTFGLFSMASATLYTAEMLAGATLDGLPVDVTAAFTTGADAITITVNNLVVNPTSIIQNLSDLSFSLSTGQTSGTLSSSMGLERTVAANGTPTDGSVVSTGWALESTTSGLHLYVLGTAIGPAHTIIGGPDGSGTYSNANGSIAGNGPHNPFLFGPVTFDLSVPGVTADTTVTNVLFSFGTSPGNNVGVPEPSTLLLLGTGLIGLWGFRRKFKK